MDINQLRQFITRAWNMVVMPTPVEYIAIPRESPSFDLE